MYITTLTNLNKNLVKKLKYIDTNNLYTKLNISDLGINMNDLSKLKLSYNNLPIDSDYPDKLTVPTRYRRHCRFNINITDNNIHIKQNHCNKFKQNVTDFRNNTREFKPIEQSTIDNYFVGLISQIISLSHYFNPIIKKYILDIHQVRLLSFQDISSDNSPEGIHKDGADYIISAMIINKHNIYNDTSLIYDKNKSEIYRCNLDVGDFIFQDDVNLWHDILPIKSCKNYIGYRDILGFDLKIND